MRLLEVSLTIAGGIILFLIAIRMVFHHPDGIFGDPPGGEPFLVPLAVPSIAGPSALAPVMLMASRDPGTSAPGSRAFSAAMLVTLVLVGAHRLQAVLGERAIVALERLMGLVLAAVWPWRCCSPARGRSSHRWRGSGRHGSAWSPECGAGEGNDAYDDEARGADGQRGRGDRAGSRVGLAGPAVSLVDRRVGRGGGDRGLPRRRCEGMAHAGRVRGSRDGAVPPLAWGFAGTRHARFASFLHGPRTAIRYARSFVTRAPPVSIGHNPLGGWSVIALLAALLVQAGTGLFANDDLLMEGPLVEFVSDAL